MLDDAEFAAPRTGFFPSLEDTLNPIVTVALGRADLAVDGTGARCHGSRVDDQNFPVTVLVRRPDGSSESVRVGTAVRTSDGFRLSLGELSIGRAADPPPGRAAAATSHGDGMVFPPYGRSKGMPIAGASIKDLEFYIGGSRRSLDDPAKARWHDKERVLLAAMEAELARTTGEASAPPAEHDEFDDGPPPSDDEIPF